MAGDKETLAKAQRQDFLDLGDNSPSEGVGIDEVELEMPEPEREETPDVSIEVTSSVLAEPSSEPIDGSLVLTPEGDLSTEEEDMLFGDFVEFWEPQNAMLEMDIIPALAISSL